MVTETCFKGTVTPFQLTVLKVMLSQPNITEVLALFRIAKVTQIPKLQDEIGSAIDNFFVFDGGERYADDVREMKEHLKNEKVWAKQQEEATQNGTVMIEHDHYEFKKGDFFDSEIGVGIILDTTKPKFLVIDGKGRGDYCARNLESLPIGAHPLTTENFGHLKAELQTILGIVRLSLNGTNHCVVA